MDNLAENLSDAKRQAIADEVLTDFKNDKESRQEWEEMHAHWVRLYYQQDTPKNAPWEGASDESIPMLAEACSQFHARASKAMFPHRNIVQAVPTTSNDAELVERGKRVSRHMSWQLAVRDKNYQKDKDRLLLGLPLHGSYFTKSRYHEIFKRPVVENVRPEDLVVPYGVGPRNIEDIERKTHILYQSLNDGRILAKRKYYLNSPQEWRPESSPGKEAQDEAHGEREHEQGVGFACVLEQHRLIDLDGDGIAEPYTVWVDQTGEQLLRIAPRWAMSPDGEPLDGKRPLEYFTHYAFIENPAGFYGLGYGHLIGRLNTACNKLLRQYIDAGTLANVGNQSGFVSKLLDVRGGEIQMQLGKFKKIDSSGDDIRRNVFQFQFPGPSPALAQALEMLMRRSDRLATVTEALTGQTEKVMQPTAILALIEQGLEIYQASYQRILGTWSEELQKVYEINARYLDREEYFTVIQSDGRLDQQSASPEDYAPDLLIQPTADPKALTKQQQLQKAEAEWQFLAQNPMTQQSAPHFYEASRRYLEAIETRDIDKVLPQPGTGEPPREDDPRKENIGAFLPEPQMTPVHMDQDHELHLKEHEALLLAEDSPDGIPDDLAGYADRLTPEGKKVLEAHVQEHIAMMYAVHEAGVMDELGQQQGNGQIPQELIGALLSGQGMDFGGLDGAAGLPEGAEGIA